MPSRTSPAGGPIRDDQRHRQFVSGIAVAIGGLIAAYVSFEALFVTMGVLSALATVEQARVSWVQERAAG